MYPLKTFIYGTGSWEAGDQEAAPFEGFRRGKGWIALMKS